MTTNNVREMAAVLGLNALSDKDIAKFIGYKKDDNFLESDWYQAVLNLAARHNRMAKKKITCSSHIYEQFSFLQDLPNEEFWLLLLNRNNGVIKQIRLSVGGVSGCVVDSKLLFHHALKHIASGIVLCHNHPSGNLNPSIQDKVITDTIKSAAKFLDIALIDHVIIANGSFFSFADEGLI